ncbi:hypothetical protein [Deinococcus sp. PEB2-67]
MTEQPHEAHVTVTVEGGVFASDAAARLSFARKTNLRDRLLAFSRESFQPNSSAKLPFYLIDDHAAVGILDELQNELGASRREVLDAIQDYTFARCVRVQVYETRPQLACVIVDLSPKECSAEQEESYMKSAARPPTAFSLHYDAETGLVNPHVRSMRLFFMRLKPSLLEAWSDTVQRHYGSMALSGFPTAISLPGDILLPDGPVRFLPHAKVRAETTHQYERVILYEVPDDAPDADQLPLIEPSALVPELTIDKRRIEIQPDEPLSADTLWALQQAALYDTEVLLRLPG